MRLSPRGMYINLSLLEHRLIHYVYRDDSLILTVALVLVIIWIVASLGCMMFFLSLRSCTCWKAAEDVLFCVGQSSFEDDSWIISRILVVWIGVLLLIPCASSFATSRGSSHLHYLIDMHKVVYHHNLFHILTSDGITGSICLPSLYESRRPLQSISDQALNYCIFEIPSFLIEYIMGETLKCVGLVVPFTRYCGVHILPNSFNSTKGIWTLS